MKNEINYVLILRQYPSALILGTIKVSDCDGKKHKFEGQVEEFSNQCTIKKSKQASVISIQIFDGKRQIVSLSKSFEKFELNTEIELPLQGQKIQLQF